MQQLKSVWWLKTLVWLRDCHWNNKVINSQKSNIPASGYAWVMFVPHSLSVFVHVHVDYTYYGTSTTTAESLRVLRGQGRAERGPEPGWVGCVDWCQFCPSTGGPLCLNCCQSPHEQCLSLWAIVFKSPASHAVPDRSKPCKNKHLYIRISRCAHTK